MKLYANDGAIITHNKELVDTYLSLNSNSAFSDTEMFKRELFDFSARVRSELGINNVISFTFDDERNALVILVYGVESVIGTTYEHGVDEQGFYILTDRQGIGTNESA